MTNEARLHQVEVADRNALCAEIDRLRGEVKLLKAQRDKYVEETFANLVELEKENDRLRAPAGGKAYYSVREVQSLQAVREAAEQVRKDTNKITMDVPPYNPPIMWAIHDETLNNLIRALDACKEGTR